MSRDCFNNIKTELVELELPDKAIKSVLSDIEKIQKDVEAGRYPGESYKTKVAEYLEDRRRLDQAQAYMRAENLRKVKKNMEFYSQEGFKKDPSEGFKAQMDKAVTLANDGQMSIKAMAFARGEKYTDYLIAGLEKTHLAKQYLSGQLDKEIMIDIHDLASGKAPSSGNADAGAIAEVVHGLNKMFFKEMWDAGIPIKELNGFIMRQSHDGVKVGSAGFETWFSKIEPLLDKKRMFGVDMNNKKLIWEKMQGMYNEIRAGVYGLDNIIADKEVGDNFVGLGAARSLADKLSESRTIHFISPEATYQYNLEFGKGNLSENIMSEIQRNATSLSLFERLGDKPQAAFEANIDRMISKLTQEGNADGASKLKGEKNRLISTYKDVAMVKNTPGNQTIARVDAAGRAIQAASKLFNVGIRSTANFAGAAVEIKNINGQNLLEATGSMFVDFFKSLPESVRNEFGTTIHNVVNDINSQHARSIGIDVGISGKAAKVSRAVTKYSGQDLLNDNTSVAIGNLIQSKLAEHALQNFNDLPPKVQASWLESGVKPAEFQLFSKAIETAEDGRKFVTPEAVGKLSESDPDVLGAMKDIGFKGNAGRFINELELKLRAKIYQSANIATTTAGPRERGALKMGTDTGTMEGLVVNWLMQFKSFTLQSFNIGRRFLNANPNTALLEKGILASQGKDLGSLAEWIVMGTALGYAADTSIRLLHGKAPKDPRDTGTWLDAMSKSGAGGMYVDFVAGEWDKYNFGSSLLGPTFGQIPQAAEAFTDMKQGDFKGGKFDKGKYSVGAVPGAIGLIKSNIPFQNAPLIQEGLNYLMYEKIQGALSPKFQQNRELKKVRDQLTGRGE